MTPNAREVQVMPTPEERRAVNTIKDLLMDSEHRIVFPLSGDLVMKFTLTRSVTREQWKRIVAVIQLAEDSCCLQEDDVDRPPPAPHREGM